MLSILLDKRTYMALSSHLCPSISRIVRTAVNCVVGIKLSKGLLKQHKKKHNVGICYCERKAGKRRSDAGQQSHSKFVRG